MALGMARGFLDKVRLDGTPRQHLEIAAIVGGIVVVAALVGIGLRSAGLLAAVSPANAILLGLMVRYPHLATPAGWAAGVAAYFIADLLTGNSLLNTLLLTVASLAGVVAGYVLLQRESSATRQLVGPMAVVRVAIILVAASAVAALFGTIGNLLVPGSASFTGFVYWLVGEFVNYLAILPVMLTLPEGLIRQYDLKSRPDLRQIDFLALAPAGALIIACAAGLFVGGPAALMFPLVALLWCALSYSVFATAVLTLLVGIWTLGGLALDVISGWPDLDEGYALVSVRLAVTLMGLAPLTVASTMAAHEGLRERYELLAAHDVLSGLFTRHAFAERSNQVLAQAAQANMPVAVLMLDIDHFKKINETYGHWAGDRAIQTFAAVLKNTLSDGVLIGRLGGEEFAALLAGASPSDGAAAAEHIRQVFAATPIDLGDGRQVEATLSIGLGCATQAPTSIEPLLQVADEALSLAKGGGRNRTVRRDLALAQMQPLAQANARSAR
ncbi:sensor domain-containing diguanylate cyclase [Hyphomicrobium sp. CS1BSMeth3]|uniref:GGDEF domain-containing protein n=1 Tax=Hyphomicrobium sp. CS1BSMeth3 TaxID=1892844 RepID=UPI000931C6F4|nr:sensor domain-containing diguanylate cyclase [Hyphomicrobium sp. CS1BSMeth3]